MNSSQLSREQIALAIFGPTALGVGLGFFYFTSSIFTFIGCTVLSVGFGLIVALALTSCERGKPGNPTP